MFLIVCNGQTLRVFANGPGDRGSIPDWAIPKTKISIDASLLNTQLYKVWIKGKVEQSRESSSYWKGSLRAILDYGHRLYFIKIKLYIYIYRYVRLVVSNFFYSHILIL